MVTKRSRARSQRTIVAFTAEDGRLDHVVRAALDLARGDGARLILYDLDAPGAFQKPLPTGWSGEGSEEAFGDLLGPADLERAGRHAIAAQVAEARAAGVDAWAWLPGSLGADELAGYARGVGADVIVVPEEPGAAGGPLKALAGGGAGEIEAPMEQLGAEVVVIPSARG